LMDLPLKIYIYKKKNKSKLTEESSLHYNLILSVEQPKLNRNYEATKLI